MLLLFLLFVFESNSKLIIFKQLDIENIFKKLYFDNYFNDLVKYRLFLAAGTCKTC